MDNMKPRIEVLVESVPITEGSTELLRHAGLVQAYTLFIVYLNITHQIYTPAVNNTSVVCTSVYVLTDILKRSLISVR